MHLENITEFLQSATPKISPRFLLHLSCLLIKLNFLGAVRMRGLRSKGRGLIVQTGR